jgi:polysaccharide deacetylase 2 family uncharacterized protein YibQ
VAAEWAATRVLDVEGDVEYMADQLFAAFTLGRRRGQRKGNSSTNPTTARVRRERAARLPSRCATNRA